VRRILIAGLLKLELPGHTVLLADGGGTVPWNGDTFGLRDSVLGVLSGFEALQEGIGDEAPAAALTFLLPDATAASAVNTGAVQNSRCRLWLSEIDADTGLLIGTPSQEADWIVDYTALSLDQGKRELEIGFVSSGDRFFQRDRGNSLAPAFHRGVHPGEAGLDNASGVATSLAWGAASPPRGVSGGGALGGSFGSFAGQVANA
jgi:hypothetical protein